MSEPPSWRPSRRTVETTAKVVVSLILLLYVIRSVDVGAVWGVLVGTELVLFLGAAGLSVINPLISSKKLAVLLRAKAGDVAFLTVVRFYYIGKFFNAFLPATVGGDAVKAHLLSKDTDQFGAAYSSVFMERFVGLFAIIGLGTTAALLSVQLLPSLVFDILFGIYFPALVIVSFLLWWDGFPVFIKTYLPIPDRVTSWGPTRKLLEVYESIHAFKTSPKPVSTAILLSVIHQTSVILSHYLLAEAIGMSVAPYYFFVLVPISTIIVFLPISIAGIGVQEATFVFLFTLVGASADQAVSLSLLVHSLALFPMVVGGIAYSVHAGVGTRWISSLRGRP